MSRRRSVRPEFCLADHVPNNLRLHPFQLDHDAHVAVPFNCRWPLRSLNRVSPLQRAVCVHQIRGTREKDVVQHRLRDGTGAALCVTRYPIRWYLVTCASRHQYSSRKAGEVDGGAEDCYQTQVWIYKNCCNVLILWPLPRPCMCMYMSPLPLADDAIFKLSVRHHRSPPVSHLYHPINSVCRTLCSQDLKPLRGTFVPPSGWRVWESEDEVASVLRKLVCGGATWEESLRSMRRIENKYLLQ